jgi:hypothetical protein
MDFVMETALKAPLAERVNVRMIVFFGVVLFLLGWPVYTFVSEVVTHGIHDHGTYKEVDLKAMGNFDLNPMTATLASVPPEYRNLDGQRVALQGEIYSPHEAGPRVTEFQLVYSIQVCCFGGPPKVQERVFATVPSGKAFNLNRGGAHKVVGILHVTMHRPEVPDGIGPAPVAEVYHLDVESVEAL